jgi:hypothetical protein
MYGDLTQEFVPLFGLALDRLFGLVWPCVSRTFANRSGRLPMPRPV